MLSLICGRMNSQARVSLKLTNQSHVYTMTLRQRNVVNLEIDLYSRWQMLSSVVKPLRYSVNTILSQYWKRSKLLTECYPSVKVYKRGLKIQVNQIKRMKHSFLETVFDM